MKCVKDIYYNKEKVNSIEYINEDAYRELSILLLVIYNNGAGIGGGHIWNTINKCGLHEISAVLDAGMNYEYHYHFDGYDVENLPVITR